MNKQLLSRIASQVSKGVKTSKTPLKNLNRKVFTDGDRKVIAIQQNPKTGSEWAQLAREGHEVVQFKDAETNKYIGVSVDGKVKEY